MKRAQGALVLALLAALSLLKAQTGVLPEMLWICHLSAAALGIGLLLEVPLLCAIGFLYHIAAGLPTYLLHVATGGDTTWVSFLIHALTPLFGWFAWRSKPLPPQTPWLAFALYLAAFGASRLCTPESLNVNLAFRPWEPLTFMGTMPGFAFNVSLMLITLLVVHGQLNRRRGLRAPVPGHPAARPDTST